MKKRAIQFLYILMTLVFLASMTSLALAAPSAQEEEEGNTVVDVAVADGRFTTLVTALEAADLVSVLQGEGPFTVFAPTDDAFAALPEGALDSLLSDVPQLTSVLLYHVVEGNVPSSEVVNLDNVQTLADNMLLDVTVDGSTVQIGPATVIQPDVEASNGVIHVIDTVLLPPAGEDAMMEEGAAMAETEAVTETETMTGTMAVEEGAMMEAAMPAACAQDYTVQAGDSLSTIAQQFYGTPGQYTLILEATNEAAAENSSYSTIADENIIEVGQVLCIPAGTGASVSAPAAAEEGEAAMEEGGEMMAETSMSDVPEGMSKLRFENFAFVDLVVDIVGPSRETLVVPPQGTNDFILEPGAYNYQGHQPGGAFAVTPGSFELAAGEALSLSCSDSKACITLPLATMEATQTVTATETVTPTQTVTATETVTPTAAMDIVDTAVAAGSFSTLASLLEAAGLVETLKGEGPFTVFAPTDEAFAAVAPETLAALQSDIEQLNDVLLYHVVGGKLMAADVVSQESLATANGASLPVVVDGATVTVGEATVVTPDVEASNGVIHIIDTVLIPPETE